MSKFSEWPVAALVATLVVLLAPTAARAANEPPVAVTGSGQSVPELALVTLDGSQSFDPDGDPLTFAWTQVAGSPVTLSDASAAQPTFVAPAQPPLGQETLMFSLTVCDPSGACSAPSTTNVVVYDVNHPPVAVTGSGQSVPELALVTLDGSQSFDPDGDHPLAFRWTQVAGSPVTLSDARAAQPTFVAPAQPPLRQETLTFSLTVCDPSGACSAPRTTNVVVQDVYIPPNCSFATASPNVLPFDPGGTLRHVSVSGVTGSASASITVSVTSVFQDEPLTGGDDHTSPDAILRPSGGVDLRAERRSNGDGRIYHISFVASDGFGGSCTGVVMVSVPRKEGVPAVDEGALYNSLGP